jgi:hypothetical protein
VAGAPVAVVDLGRQPFSRLRQSGVPRWSKGYGLGWQELDARWVDGQLSAGVVASFGAWIAERDASSDPRRLAYLLGRRVNLLRAVPPGDGGAALRCAASAAARAADAASAHEATAQQEAARLAGLLGALPALRAGDKMVLGVLLAKDTWGVRPVDASAVARPLGLFAEVEGDPRAGAELRARAAEQIAEIELRREVRMAQGVGALRRVIALTKDPDLRIETLVKLATLNEDDAAREKLLTGIVAEIDRRGHDWQLAEALGDLATLRLRRGAFEPARDAALRCALEVPKDFPDKPDPWGCAPTLAEALAELGGAPRGVEVPLPFLGPLSLAVMDQAIARHDRDEARRAGELLMARLSGAKEAPQVLDLLSSMTRDPEAKRALAERRGRDFGPGSAWLAAQRARLAPDHDLSDLDATLARLVEPSHLLVSPPPVGEEKRRAELLRRLEAVVYACERELAGAARDIALHVDTTRPVPVARADGARAAARVCLVRRAESHFRSVGPATIKVTLFPE